MLYTNLQAIFRRVRTGGLLAQFTSSENVRRIIKMLMALALLPEDLVEEAFAKIKAYAETLDILPTLEPIFRQGFIYFNFQHVSC